MTPDARADATEGPKGQGPLSSKHRWGTGRRPGGPPPRKEGFGRIGERAALGRVGLAVGQRPISTYHPI